MEELVKQIAQYGLPGLVAALAIIGYLRKDAEVSRLRDRIEENEKKSAETVRATAVHNTDKFQEQATRFATLADTLRDNYSKQVVSIAELFARKAEDIQKDHREQEDELTERLLTMTERVTTLVSTLRKKEGGE
jgi:hypothetical protein